MKEYSIYYTYEDETGFHRILTGIKAESKDKAKDKFIAGEHKLHPKRDIIKVEILK